MKEQRLEFNTKEKAEKVIHANRGKRRMFWWSSYQGDKKIYFIFYHPINNQGQS